MEMSRGIASALFNLGAMQTDVVNRVDIIEAARKWGKLGGGEVLFVELGFASKWVQLLFGLCWANVWFYSSRTNSEVGRELGWQPQKTKEDFKNHFLEEAGLIVAAELSVDSA